jgi:hypothetical protein
MAVLRLRVVWQIVHTLAVADRLVYRSGCRPARDERVPGQSGQSGGRAAVRVRVPARTRRGTHGVPYAAVVGTTSLPWPVRGRPVAHPRRVPSTVAVRTSAVSCRSGAPSIAAAWALGPVPQLQAARRWRPCSAKYVQVRAAAAPLP